MRNRMFTHLYLLRYVYRYSFHCDGIDFFSAEQKSYGIAPNPFILMQNSILMAFILLYLITYLTLQISELTLDLDAKIVYLSTIY